MLDDRRLLVHQQRKFQMRRSASQGGNPPAVSSKQIRADRSAANVLRKHLKGNTFAIPGGVDDMSVFFGSCIFLRAGTIEVQDRKTRQETKQRQPRNRKRTAGNLGAECCIRCIYLREYAALLNHSRASNLYYESAGSLQCVTVCRLLPC